MNATSERNIAQVTDGADFSVYGPMVNSALYAITSAAFAPLVLLFIAWQLDPPFQKQDLQGAMGYSLMTAAIPLLLAVQIISRCLEPHGLAERFLSWPSNLCAAILKTAKPIAWLCVPLLWMYTALESFEGGKWNDSLGRFAFVAAMLVFGLGLARTNASIRSHCSQCKNSEQRLSVWMRLFLNVLNIGPFALIVLSLTGYCFTAVQLGWRLYWTLAIITSMALIASFISRTLLITQFRARVLQAREAPGHDDSDSLDITKITAQVNRLLYVTSVVAIVVVAWQIWSSVLPVVGYLESVELWNVLRDGVKVAVSLKDLLLALSLMTITMVLSRNLPGLLEIVLLDRLPLDRGGRYAISFVCRYLVVVAGLLMSFSWLGFSWNSVQWLAAGLTVGLGFGLQEIFANLVSGLIILMERPVRVGDFVTVNGVSGHVTQMQLRATTVKDLNNRELIVPNKKFITEDVMNWTLSDRSTRVVINVGIAYGSDTARVQTVLTEVAKAHPLVKNIPVPEVVFLAFGDSTLNFELRVMISTREVYFRVIHDLNIAIDAAFREAGIEIAFPQLQLHASSFEAAASKAA